MKINAQHIEGRDWKLYAMEYDTPDGTFGFRIRAISMEHAAAMLADIRATGRLLGEVAEIIPLGGETP
jgi:hypothetical protein